MVKKNIHDPIATIPLPSADLINFRFDALEKAQSTLRSENKQNFDILSHKLDYMVETFITRTEFNDFRSTKDQEHKEIWVSINNTKNSFKFWVTTAVAVAGVIAVVIATYIKP